jgi:hypothetical protein
MRFESLKTVINPENFYGIEVTNNITIKNMQLKIGKNEIIVLFSNLNESNNLLDYYIVLKYLFSLEPKIKIIFALLMSPGMRFIRKKIRTNIIENFSPENLLNLLGGRDLSIYYSDTELLEQVLGTEIRFEKEHTIDIEELLTEIIRKLGSERTKIFNNP